MEAALLIESQWRSRCDQIWVVTAPKDQILQRLQLRNGLTAEQTRSRIDSQLRQEERLPYADVVLENQGLLADLLKQVDLPWPNSKSGKLMKTSLHLILDCRKPHMRFFFWRRHGLRIMERLTPAGLSFLTPHMMLEQELRKALHGGSKRLVIIGSPELLSQTFHLLMKEFEGRQPPCEIGFWLFTKKEAWFSMLQTSDFQPPLAYLPKRACGPGQRYQSPIYGPKLTTRDRVLLERNNSSGKWSTS